jgi:hypothetical protein
MTVDQIVLDPLLPWLVVWAALRSSCWPWALAAWRGLAGWWLRGLAGLALLAALLNPVPAGGGARAADRHRRGRGGRERLAARVGPAAQTAEALAHLEAEVAARENTELRVVRVGDAEGDGGIARDGRAGRGAGAGAAGAHRGDGPHHRRAGPRPAPDALPAGAAHTLLTGREGDWDRGSWSERPGLRHPGRGDHAHGARGGPGRGAGDAIVPLSISGGRAARPCSSRCRWARTWTCRWCCPMRA